MTTLSDLAGTKARFASSALNSAVQKAQHTFDKYTSSIDAISSDIKALETYLRQKGIALPFAFSLEMQSKQEVRQYTLLWRDADKGGFRLMYETLEEDSFGNESPSVARPLVEAPLSVRTLLYPFLPLFVEKLAAELASVISSVSEAKQTPSKISVSEFFGEKDPFEAENPFA